MQGPVLGVRFVGQPGVVAAHDDAQHLPLLAEVHQAELQTQVLAVGVDQPRRQHHALVVEADFHVFHFAVEGLFKRVGQPHAAQRHVQRAGFQHMAVGQIDRRRQHQRHPHVGAHLALLAGGGDRRQQGDQTEAGPEHIEQHHVTLDGVVLVPIEPHQAAAQTQRQQKRHHQMRTHRADVEKALFQKAAFFGDVERTLLGVPQRHQRRFDQMKAEHRFVNLAPEGVAETAVEPRVGPDRMEQVRQGVGEDHRRGRGDDVLAEQQVGQRRGDEHYPWQGELEMQHGVQITEPLRQGQAAAEQRIVHPQDLRHAACPARPLADVQGQPLGGQARRQRQADERGAPAFALEAQCGVGVLGDRFHREAVGLVQGFTADHRAGAAEEGGVPEVVALLHRPVEQLALAGQLLADAQIALERVLGIEIVRGLHHRQLGVFEKAAHGGLQKTGGGNVIAIEHADQFAVGLTEGVVQIAGLGVLIVGAGDVAHPGALGERLEAFPPAVVQHVDAYLVGRVIQVLGRQNRIGDHLQAFVIGGNIDVHRGPQGGVVRQRHQLAFQRPERLQITEQKDHQGIQLGQEQAIAEHCFRHAFEMQRRGGAPPDIAAGDDQRQRHQPQGHAPRIRPHTVHQRHQQHAGGTQQRLVPRVHGRGDEQQHRRYRQQTGEREHAPPPQRWSSFIFRHCELPVVSPKR